MIIDKKRRVLFVIGTDWASGYYRMTQPAHQLQELGFNVDIINFRDLDISNLVAWVSVLVKVDKGNSIISNDAKIDTFLDNKKEKKVDLTEYHTVIFQLVWDKTVLGIMQRLKDLGVKVVLELDDDYIHLPSHNNAYYQFHPKYKLVSRDGKTYARKHDKRVNDSLDTMKKACKIADFLQLSTPELAETYKHLNRNSIVLLNCVDNTLFDKADKVENKEPTICWYGTRTHIEDLRMVIGCIPYETKIFIAGCEDFKDSLFKDYKNTEAIGGFDLKEDLPKIIKKCDIGITPLEDSKFNAGKSELKGLEFGAGGLPIISSDVAPYRRYVKHEYNGFIVKKNKTKFWIRYINKLLNNKKLRETIGRNNKKEAIKRDITNYIDNWVEVYFK